MARSTAFRDVDRTTNRHVLRDDYIIKEKLSTFLRIAFFIAVGGAFYFYENNETERCFDNHFSSNYVKYFYNFKDFIILLPVIPPFKIIPILPGNSALYAGFIAWNNQNSPHAGDGRFSKPMVLN